MNRRRFLALAAVASGALAGCNEDRGGEQATTTADPTAGTSTSPSTQPTTSPDPGRQAPEVDLTWEPPSGPPGGPVTDVAISPTDPDWLYATTQTAGMFVSSDGGQHWTQGTEAMHHRGKVWVSPHDPTHAYSVYDRTTDGGRTWSTVHTGAPHHWYPDVRSVHDLSLDPFEEDTAFVGTDQGLYRTRNGGDSWVRLALGGSEDAGEVRQVAVHPDIDGAVAAGVRNEAVFLSSDRGESWSTVRGTSDIVNNIPRELVFAGPVSTDAYVSINGGGMYRVGGDAPENLTTDLGPLRFSYVSSSSPLAADATRLYFIASTDLEHHGYRGFQLFVYEAGSDTVHALETPEQPVSVTTHPTDPSRVYLGGISQVHESRDGGRAWERLGSGFRDGYLATVGVNPTRPGTVLTGTICSGGLFVSHDNADSFEWKRSGLGPFHQGAFNEHYVMQTAALGDHAYATTAAGLLISEDNARSWRLLENEFSGSGSIEGHGDDPAKHLHGLAVSPDDPQTVFVGTGLGGPGDPEDAFDGVSFIWLSTDGGDSWVRRTDGFPTSRDTVVQDILVRSHDTDVVYAGTNAEDYLAGGHGHDAGEGLGLFRSTNGGRDWTRLPTPFSNVHALAEDPDDPGRLFASTPTGLYRRTGQGGAWARILPGNVKGLLVHPSAPDTVFAGVRSDAPYWDLLVSLDGGDIWGTGGLTIQVGRGPDQRAYDGIDPHADYRPQHGEINWLALDEGTETLYAATRAAGLWRTDVSELRS